MGKPQNPIINANSSANTPDRLIIAHPPSG